MLRLIILRILESYFRHRWLYLLPIVLMIGLGIAFMKPTYTSKGVLYVETQSYLASLTAVRDSQGVFWLTPGQAVSQEFNELLKTDAFVRAIIQQTDLEEVMDKGTVEVNNIIVETRKNVWAAPLGGNQLLVNAEHEDPVIAYQIVTAAIDGYLRWRINAGLVESEVAQVFFRDLINSYEADLTAARAEMQRYLETHPIPLRGERPGVELLEIDRLQADIDLAASRYATALDKEENTRLSIIQIESDARQTYFLIDAPHVPEKPNRALRRRALQAGVFVVVGMLLSGGLIVGTAIIDRSFRFPIDVTHRLDLPVVAMVSDTPIISESPLSMTVDRSNN